MADAYEKARDEFITAMERITASFSFPALAGRIYGLLAFTPNPMSLDEISARLHAAKSGVSVNIRLIENFGLVRKVWIKGDRRDYYEADLGLVKVYYDFFKQGMEKETKPFFDAVERCLRILNGDATGEIEADAEVIKRQLERELKIKEPLIAIFDRLISDLELLKTEEDGA
jgi:DNA-binding transcriptional regulator GbsR (MarR family)